MAVAEKELVTFSAFEGKLEGNTVKGVSIIQEGPALGHGVWVDRKALDQVKRVASSKGKLKAKLNHWSGLQDTVGLFENFRIRGGKVVADLELYESHPGRDLLLEMISKAPATFGVSIMFRADEPEYDKENDRYNTRVRELYSADFVDTPAANQDGVFEAQIDSGEEDMANTAPAAVTLEAFEAYKAENDSKTAKIEALEAEIAALKAAPAKAPEEDPKPDALAAKIQEAITTAFKVHFAAPPTKQEPAPVNEPETITPPKSYADARKEAIGAATGLARIAAARAFDEKHANEAAYLASFKK
jgi:hypothetical protein